MEDIEIKIEKVDPELPLPEYSHGEEDVGMDLRSSMNTAVRSGEWKLVKTGIKMSIPKGYGGFVSPRSGMALKEGITVLNSPGVIDPGYRGELGVILINHSDEDFFISKGDRIAQFIVLRTPRIEWNLVDDLEDSERGETGFGGTGKK